MSHLDESDHERIADIVHSNIEYWLGIATFLILRKLNEVENRIMSAIADLVADEAGLKTALQSLIDAFNAAKAGTLTPEQQAQVDALDAALKADAAAAADAVTPPPTP